jgi:hypothetical protein
VICPGFDGVCDLPHAPTCPVNRGRGTGTQRDSGPAGEETTPRATAALAGEQAAAQTSSRSDPRKRRSWLRDLDAVLTHEIGLAGSLSCGELGEPASRPLKNRATRSTIEEWWEYAFRRGWLEEHAGGRCRLAAACREDLRTIRAGDQWLDPAHIATAIARWVLPAGALGATGYLSGSHPGAVVVILVVGIGLTIGLFLTAPLVRVYNRRLERQTARRACDWLEDRPVRFAAAAPAAGEARTARLYGPGERSAPGLEGL